MANPQPAARGIAVTARGAATFAQLASRVQANCGQCRRRAVLQLRLGSTAFSRASPPPPSGKGYPGETGLAAPPFGLGRRAAILHRLHGRVCSAALPRTGTINIVLSLQDRRHGDSIPIETGRRSADPRRNIRDHSLFLDYVGASGPLGYVASTARVCANGTAHAIGGNCAGEVGLRYLELCRLDRASKRG